MKELQKQVMAWARKTFGDIASNPRERALRLVEESLEFAQAVGIERYQLLRMAWNVYERPPGIQSNELAGVALTAAAAAEVMGADLSLLADWELRRVSSRAVTARCKKRQAEKHKLGLTGDTRPKEAGE